MHRMYVTFPSPSRAPCPLLSSPQGCNEFSVTVSTLTFGPHISNPCIKHNECPCEVVGETQVLLECSPSQKRAVKTKKNCKTAKESYIPKAMFYLLVQTSSLKSQTSTFWRHQSSLFFKSKAIS